MFTVEPPPSLIQALRLIIELDDDKDQAQGTARNDQKAQGDNEKAPGNSKKAQGNNSDI